MFFCNASVFYLLRIKTNLFGFLALAVTKFTEELLREFAKMDKNGLKYIETGYRTLYFDFLTIIYSILYVSVQYGSNGRHYVQHVSWYSPFNLVFKPYPIYYPENYFLQIFELSEKVLQEL